MVPSMQTTKQWKYCWYLDFFIIFGILIAHVHSENSCFILILKEKWQGFNI